VGGGGGDAPDEEQTMPGRAAPPRRGQPDRTRRQSVLWGRTPRGSTIASGSCFGSIGGRGQRKLARCGRPLPPRHRASSHRACARVWTSHHGHADTVHVEPLTMALATRRGRAAYSGKRRSGSNKNHGQWSPTPIACGSSCNRLFSQSNAPSGQQERAACPSMVCPRLRGPQRRSQAAGPHHLVVTHVRRPSPVAATPALDYPP